MPNEENNKDMASLYKKPIVVVDPKTGKKTKTKSKKWWGRYRDETGVERRVPLASDKTAAQTMLNALVVKEERKAAGIEDPFDLTGVYQGLPLHEKSISHSGALPDRISLFRQPILDEWVARGDETLEHLVAHVLVHEVGHHFGLSDETMHALEDAVTD